MRILHVLRTPVGGLFRHVLDVARGQVARGHEVGIFCDSSTGGPRADEILEALRPQLALGVHRIPMRRAPHPRDLAALAVLTNIYRRARPNVLHGHGSKGGVFARLVSVPGLDRKTIRVYTPHGGSFHYQPGSIGHVAYMQAESLLGRRTDLFLFESDFVRRRFAEFVGPTTRLVRVVHNGVADEEFEPLERVPDPFDLLYLGEIRTLKGIDTLIDAIGIIRRDHGLRLTLLAVGAGPDEGELHERAKAAGIWDSTAFVPPQPIRSALARARIMVIPSRAESLPYVILEAAAAKQPLVSTNVGGIPEIFGPRSDELVPANDPGRLASAILVKVAESEDVRRDRADALGRYVHEGFRIDRMVEGGLEGYRDAFAARRIPVH